MKLTVNNLLTPGDCEVSETLKVGDNGRLRDENDKSCEEPTNRNKVMFDSVLMI